MQDLSLHILDIVENSINAGARTVEINIQEKIKENLLVLEIIDDGQGMDKNTIAKVLDPFYTTKKAKRIGLGLSMLAQATKEANGSFDIKSRKGKGTTVIAKFSHDHIDRKPFGDVVETIIGLVAAHGQSIDFVYRYRNNNKGFIFDTKSIKKELQGAPINDPEVLDYLKKIITEELKNMRVGV